jgi:hypothetical protein
MEIRGHGQHTPFRSGANSPPSGGATTISKIITTLCTPPTIKLDRSHRVRWMQHWLHLTPQGDLSQNRRPQT